METTSIWRYIIEVISIVIILAIRDFFVRIKDKKVAYKKILTGDWDVDNPIKYRWNIVRLKNREKEDVFLPVNKWSFEPSHHEIIRGLTRGLK